MVIFGFRFCLIIILVMETSSEELVSTPSGLQALQDHSVAIITSACMNPVMKLEAQDVLRSALKFGDISYACVLLRDYFERNYPNYYWNAILYNNFAIYHHMYISFKVDGVNKVLLFAISKKPH